MVPIRPKRVSCEDSQVGLLDVLHAAPRIWTLLTGSDIAALRCCSNLARALHDGACTTLNVVIRKKQPLLPGVTALKNIISRGCKPVELTVTTHVALPPEITHDILASCARTAVRVALLGPHPGLRELAATAPSLQCLSLDLYDMSASQAADGLLATVGSKLTSLDLQLYGGAVLPCEGLAACGAVLAELRLRLSIDRIMHIGPFKYGLQHTLQRRRGAGSLELREAAAQELRQRQEPQPQPQDHCQGQGQDRQGRPGGAATRQPGPASSAITAVEAASEVAAARRSEVPLASSAAGSKAVGAAPAAAGSKAALAPGGGSSGGGGSVGGRPVPPAVAAIASLSHLRCLELYGSAIDRILDTPYRLLGITALRNLTRLRIDLPPNHDDTGGGRAAVHASAAWYGGNAGNGAATPAASADGAGAWRLDPLLASLTWLRDLDLGMSYALPPEALPSLASLSQLVQLRCGTILTPPPQHRQQQWQVPPNLWSQADGVASRAAESEMVAGAAPLPLPGLLLRLPLPPSLQHLRFATLPAVPVLAALACLPALQTLGCEPPSAADVHLAAADPGGRRRQAFAGNDGGVAVDSGAGRLSPPSAHASTGEAAPTATAAAAATRGVNAAPSRVPFTAIHRVPATKAGSVVAGAAAANGHCTAAEVDQGQDDARPCSALTRRPTRCAATATAVTVAAAARSDVACNSSGSLGGGGAAAPEPLRLALAGEDFVHEHRLQAVGRPEEVAVAGRLLRRLFPPAALRRLALQPFGRSPAMLEGPHAGWLAELAPLADVVEGVEMVAFLLAPGDLDALRGALPRLKTLNLYMCRLDADDVRRLQDAQPSLAFRMDASCEYAGAYGAYGGSEYGSAMDGEGSDEFVDEAEAADGDPEPQGFWPVAFELQRAYERALDVSEEDGDEEGDGDGEGDDRGEQEAGEEEEEVYRGPGREAGDMEDGHEGMEGEAEGVLVGEA